MTDRRYRRRLSEQERHRQELHVQQMTEDAVVRTERVEQKIQRLTFLLHAAMSLPVEPLDFEQLKKRPPTLDLGADAEPLPVPSWEEYAPQTHNRLLTLLQPVLGPASRLLKRDWRPTTEAEAEAEAAYSKALERYRADEAERQRRVAELTREHHEAHAQELQEVLAHNASIDEFREKVFAGERKSVTDYFTRIFERIVDRPSFPRGRRVAYVPESRLLLIEWEVPKADVIPREKEYRYNRATDSVGVHKWRSATEIRGIYNNIVCQMGLRAIRTAFAADPSDLVDVVVFNGVAPSEDASPCLVTMSATRRHFGRINLENLPDPVDVSRRHCGAELSPYPEELAGITPILPYELADPDLEPAPEARALNLATAPIEDVRRQLVRLLERMGYQVSELVDAPGGYLAVADGKRCVVHVRRSKQRLETSEARALTSAVRRERADSGMLFAIAHVDWQAYEYQLKRPIRIYDTHNVLVLCHKHGLPARFDAAEGSDQGVTVPEQHRHDRAPSTRR
jgi:restriction system protein